MWDQKHSRLSVLKPLSFITWYKAQGPALSYLAGLTAMQAGWGGGLTKAETRHNAGNTLTPTALGGRDSEVKLSVHVPFLH